jgi:PilZ domain
MSVRSQERVWEQARVRLEKRREQRRPVTGSVRVSFHDTRAREIEGRLIDVSDSGFRMAHALKSLTTGQVVEFSHDEASGQARVMWNRIVEGKVETGFLVIGR